MAKTKSPKPVLEPEEPGELRTTGVTLPKETLDLAFEVSALRRKKFGTRSSVSAVIRDLVEKHKGDLERELKAG